MKFHLHGSARTVADVLKRARAAEAAGFAGIFLADSQLTTLDPFQVLSLCATQTNRIRLGTAVSNMVYRDPTILANAAATVNEISEGRAVLGMGTGDGPVYRLGRTATRLAQFEEGIRTLRALLQGKPISVPGGKERREGKVTLRVGKLPVPVYISAEGPRTLRLAGRAADGVILGSGFDLRVLDWARDQIAEGAREAGRSPSEIDIMPAGMIYVDADGKRARRLVRPRLANRAHHKDGTPGGSGGGTEVHGGVRCHQAYRREGKPQSRERLPGRALHHRRHPRGVCGQDPKARASRRAVSSADPARCELQRGDGGLGAERHPPVSTRLKNGDFHDHIIYRMIGHFCKRSNVLCTAIGKKNAVTSPPK